MKILKLKPVLSLLALLFFSVGGLAETTSMKLSIDIGEGIVKLYHLDGLGLSQDEIKEIEDELLKDRTLLSLTMNNQMITIDMHGKQLKKKNAKEIKDSIRSFIQKKSAISSKSKAPSHLHKSAPDYVSTGSFVVKKGEAYSDVVILGGNVDIYGKVKNLVVLGGNIHIHKGGLIRRDLAVLGGNVQIDENAGVNNQVVLLGGNLKVKEGGWLKDDVVILGGSLLQDQGAYVAAPATYLHLPNWGGLLSQFMSFGGSTGSLANLSMHILYFFTVTLVLALCMWLFPSLHQAAQKMITEAPLKGLAFSLFYALTLLPLVLILCISVVGIFLIPLLFSLALIFIPLGIGESVRWLGGKVSQSFSLLSIPQEAPSFKQELLLAGIGLFFLELVSWVPYIGSMVILCFYVLGFGVLWGALYQLTFKKKAQLSPMLSV